MNMQIPEGMLQSYLQDSVLYPIADGKRRRYLRQVFDSYISQIQSKHRPRNLLAVDAAIHNMRAIVFILRCLIDVTYGVCNRADQELFISKMIAGNAVAASMFSKSPIPWDDVESMRALINSTVHAYAASIERAGDSVAV